MSEYAGHPGKQTMLYYQQNQSIRLRVASICLAQAQEHDQILLMQHRGPFMHLLDLYPTLEHDTRGE
jgi:hypothetical protein